MQASGVYNVVAPVTAGCTVLALLAVWGVPHKTKWSQVRLVNIGIEIIHYPSNACFHIFLYFIKEDKTKALVIRKNSIRPITLKKYKNIVNTVH